VSSCSLEISPTVGVTKRKAKVRARICFLTNCEMNRDDENWREILRRLDLHARGVQGRAQTVVEDPFAQWMERSEQWECKLRRKSRSSFRKSRLRMVHFCAAKT